jgi:hypothetical protein
MARLVDVLAEGMQDYPRLPDQVPAAPRSAPADEGLLADGCYFACYGPLGLQAPTYHGALRIETRWPRH